jgi:hypothetical protein
MLQYTYHYIKDIEFSGVFDIGIHPKNRGGYIKYFLFIKFCDLIYIDIKGVGSIILTFEELTKHKYLKMYYDLSLVLLENKHKIIEKKTSNYYYTRDYNKTIYKEDREWFIDSAYFVEDFSTKIKKIETGKYYLFYDINPNDLRSMKVSKAFDVARFHEVLNIRYRYEQGKMFKGLFIDYTNLMIKYNVELIGKEVEKISVSQEDDKNYVNLLELNKKGMNTDIFNILYNIVISEKSKTKLNYNPYV